MPFLVQFNAPDEPFDTAVVLLALSRGASNAVDKRMIESARAYLVDTQLQDGSWQETTRPANAVSYAQCMSTTGWVTAALIATAPGGMTKD